LKPLHPLDQIRLRRPEHEMVMVVHQDPRKHLPPAASRRLAQGGNEQLSVRIVEDNRFTTTPGRDQRLTLGEANQCRLHSSQFPRAMTR
jgi:hypothetical protein